MLPEELIKAWRHCGITVRGAWRHPHVEHRLLAHEDHWQLLMLETGSLTASYAVGSYQLEPGLVLLSSPGMAVELQTKPGTSVLDIQFSAIPAPGSPIPWSMLELPVMVKAIDGSSLSKLPSLMSKSYRWANMTDAMQARFTVDQFLWQMVDQGFKQGDFSFKSIRPAWLRDAIQAAQRYLRDPDFNVESFAKLAGCSSRHLHRCVQKSDGISPHVLLRRMRIERAAHMLQQNPSYETEELAANCGFSSSRHFRDQWKVEMGIGLREYRTQYRS